VQLQGAVGGGHRRMQWPRAWQRQVESLADSTASRRCCRGEEQRQYSTPVHTSKGYMTDDLVSRGSPV